MTLPNAPATVMMSWKLSDFSVSTILRGTARTSPISPSNREGLFRIDVVVTDAAGKPLLEQLTTITFVEQNGKTTMTMHSRAVAVAEVGVGHLQGMEIGWTQTIDRLEALLARSA